MSSHSNKFSDPTVFGPGLWFSIHTYAIRATTKARKHAFIDYMEMIAESLKCETCRMHATKYITENPMDRYIDDLFRWTWIFHNAVNQRLKKEELDYNTAHKLYANADTGICRSDCGADATTSQGSQGSPPIGVSAGKVDPKSSVHIPGSSEFARKVDPKFIPETSLLTTVLPPPMPKVPKGSSDQVRYVPTSARTNQRFPAVAPFPIQSSAQLTVGQSATQLTVGQKRLSFRVQPNNM